MYRYILNKLFKKIYFKYIFSEHVENLSDWTFFNRNTQAVSKRTLFHLERHPANVQKYVRFMC